MQTDSKNASTNAKPNSESASVLALIPAYNETPHIVSVVTGALAHLPVLVVDDGSTDDTAARARASGAAVLRQTPNQGKGTALRTGFR
jgi:glycosyltransferase involved in cell wall biosynthesis